VANDPDRLARFGREAQVLAALNHPNIAHIHGLEESGGIRALVMELVEGEDLSQRIARGALPLDEALPIAARSPRRSTQRTSRGSSIAISSREHQGAAGWRGEGAGLRPGQGTRSWRVEHRRDEFANANGPRDKDRRDSRTAAYMSPEQARGKSVDKRADIWAFGVVVFEMLTGRRAFEGEMASDVLAKLIEREPDWTALDGSVPPRLRELLRRCLKKDPKARLRDVGEACLWIDELLQWGDRGNGPGRDPGGRGQCQRAGSAPGGRSAARAPRAVARDDAVTGVAAAGWLYPSLGRPSQPSLEVSTEEFQQILKQEQAIVLDARPHLEYSISHIPAPLTSPPAPACRCRCMSPM